MTVPRYAGRLVADCDLLHAASKVVRGVIIGVDVMNLLASIVALQCNPEALKRTLAPHDAKEHAEAMALRLRSRSRLVVAQSHPGSN